MDLLSILWERIANPIGSYWSAVMMLENLGELKAAQKVNVCN